MANGASDITAARQRRPTGGSVKMRPTPNDLFETFLKPMKAVEA